MKIYVIIERGHRDGEEEVGLIYRDKNLAEKQLEALLPAIRIEEHDLIERSENED